MFILFILLNLLLTYTSGSILNTSNVNVLKEHLLQNYRSDTIPTHGSPLDLNIGIAFIAFNNIDQKEGIISLNLWLRYYWNDYHLQWNETESNISTIVMRSDPQLDNIIWTPDIYLYNTAENPLENLKWSNLQISSNGDILWSRPGVIQSTCLFDMTNFPYDIQVCDLKFGSWSYTGSQIRLIDGPTTIDLNNYQKNEEWELSNVNYSINSIKYACCPEEYYDITFTIHLKRLTGYYETNIIIPTFATASLILITLLIPWDSGERISFAVTVMLSIIVFLLILSDNIPKSNQQPLLSRMIMALTFFSLFGVFFTVVISALHSYTNNKIEDNEKIENSIVRILHKFFKLFCIFTNTCNKKENEPKRYLESGLVNTQSTTDTNVISTNENNLESTTETDKLSESNLENIITIIDDNTIEIRSSSYMDATNSQYGNILTRRHKIENNKDNLEITENNISHFEENNDIPNNEDYNQQQKNKLKEECDKMISILETVYSIGFFITFITLCYIMFSAKK